MPSARHGIALAPRLVMTDTKSSAHAFTEGEEEFFRSGSSASEAEPAERFADLDEGYRRPTLWQRLFGRTSARNSR
jgi:hypothetical protein